MSWGWSHQRDAYAVLILVDSRSMNAVFSVLLCKYPQLFIFELYACLKWNYCRCIYMWASEASSIMIIDRSRNRE